MEDLDALPASIRIHYSITIDACTRDILGIWCSAYERSRHIPKMKKLSSYNDLASLQLTC